MSILGLPNVGFPCDIVHAPYVHPRVWVGFRIVHVSRENELISLYIVLGNPHLRSQVLKLS